MRGEEEGPVPGEAVAQSERVNDDHAKDRV